MSAAAYRPVLPALMVEDAVRAALLEDWGRAGDITAQATLAPDTRARAVIAARQPGVLAGLDLAATLSGLPILRFQSRRCWTMAQG